MAYSLPCNMRSTELKIYAKLASIHNEFELIDTLKFTYLNKVIICTGIKAVLQKEVMF